MTLYHLRFCEMDACHDPPVRNLFMCSAKYPGAQYEPILDIGIIYIPIVGNSDVRAKSRSVRTLRRYILMSEIVKRPWGRFVLPSLLLLLALCLVFIPTLGSDKTDGAEINTYFEYEGNQYKITGETTVWFDRYNGSSDSFTMPDTVQYEGVTYYVTELNGAAFKDNSNLTSPLDCRDSGISSFAT